ncbi:hypothetical protein CHUAL_012843 [Chamberlinius hualienensis]
MSTSKKIVVAKKPRGIPQESDFRLEILENVGADLKDQEFLCQAEWITVDPYLRFHIDVGDSIPGGQVAKVIKSRNDDFPVGSYVVGYLGWETVTVASPKSKVTLLPAEIIEGNFSHSFGLGALGMPGMTAYFGFLELCKPKAGEVALVTAAAGAVGSLVGQIAKIKGCTVIGFAGSDEKIEWLKELGFDHVFNYKKVDVDQALKKAAPNGIDCYFDNVGGQFSSKVLWHMNALGRICVCGAISTYNDLEDKITLAPCVQLPLITRQLTMTGFLVFSWEKEYPRGLKQLAEWIKEGKINCRETVTEGFENLPKAFVSLFTGDNIGKAVVKI